MKSSHKAIFAGALLAVANVGATVINFDNLTPLGTFGPTSGSGFVDSGFRFSINMDAIDVGPGSPWAGAADGNAHSGQFVALNNYHGNMVMTKDGGGTFSVQDLWLHGWFGLTNNGAIEGLLNGNVVGSVSANFSNSWQNFALNFSGVDSLRISTNTNFLVDDIQVNGVTQTVAEPTSLALFGVALAGFAALRRRKS